MFRFNTIFPALVALALAATVAGLVTQSAWVMGAGGLLALAAVGVAWLSLWGANERYWTQRRAEMEARHVRERAAIEAWAEAYRALHAPPDHQTT